MKKLILQTLILTLIIGCSPKIKSITEYQKKDDKLSKNRVANFDKNGNKILLRNFGNQRSNRIVRTEYLNGKKFKETYCDYFAKQDTCVIRQFSVYEYKPDENLKMQTMYESDSAVRFIRKYYKKGNLEVIKTNTWEMFATKDPNPEKAMKLTDSVYYDSKGREVKRLHYIESFEKPWMEKYTYSDKGYTKEILGTRMDTIKFHKYSELDKLAKKKGIDFDFRDTTDYKYKFDYY